MKKIILGLVGPIASGKGAMKDYLIKKYGAQDCRFSTSLRDVLTRLDLPTTRENMQNISTVLRGQFGEDLLARAVAKDARELSGDLVAVDGVRRMADIKYLREAEGFKLVAISADPKIRFERVKSRNENEGDDQKTYEQFCAEQQAETEQEIPKVMATADFNIKNEGTMEEFYKQIDQILAALK